MAHCTVFDWQLALDNEVTQLLVLDTELQALVRSPER